MRSAIKLFARKKIYTKLKQRYLVNNMKNYY